MAADVSAGPRCRIALDAMGGDRAPEEIVAGALEAASDDVAPVLFGRRELLEPLAQGLEIVHAEDVVAMDEKPADAAREKRGSSMFAACRAVGEGKAGAVVSAGNTGAMLAAGLLEIARVARGGGVEWVEVPDPLARRTPARRQVRGSTRFQRGEGIWLDGDTLYVSTTSDHRVHAYDVRRGRIEVIYDGLASRSAPLLRVDQLTGSRAGEVFVCEDIATDEIDMGLITPDRKVSKFLSVTGPKHRNSELTGVTFDPSGTRMFFSSQRAFPKSDQEPGPGTIYEITGPFKGAGARAA